MNEASVGDMKMQVKQSVQALLDRLPEDCSLDDVQYHLYVLQSIERGQADAKAGRTISHQEVARELRKKWLVDSADVRNKRIVSIPRRNREKQC